MKNRMATLLLAAGLLFARCQVTQENTLEAFSKLHLKDTTARSNLAQGPVTSPLPPPREVEIHGARDPEGHLIFASYVDENTDYEILMADLKDDARRCLTCKHHNISSPRQPAWSPDGQRLAFTAFRTDDAALVRRLWMMSSDGSQLVDLTGATADATSPKWSPDGEFLTFSSGNGDQSEICMVHVSSQESHCLTHDLKYDGDAAWSPDGMQIAFASSRALGDGRQLYTMRPDGTDVKLLNDLTGRVGYLEWSPDGQYIAFAHTARTSQILVVHVESGQWIEVTPAGVSEDSTTPVWLSEAAQIGDFTNRP